jgi:hypothetical protein
LRQRLPRGRVATFLVLAILLGAPAAVLRFMCVGDSCATSAEAATGTPFCSLPEPLRASVTSAVRDGRSGELIAVTEEADIAGGSAFPNLSGSPLWPSLETTGRVPIVLAGPGVEAGTELSPTSGLDDVAPSIARLLDFPRRHDEVRSGEAAIDSLDPAPTPIRLVLLIAWKGIGSSELLRQEGAWPTLQATMDRGASTVKGVPHSLSADPAGPLTTLGTGGTPAQHGITGTLLRNDQGELVKAWGPKSPINVIATLAEDLDEDLNQEPLVGLVATDAVDRGLVGGDWYVDHDRDQMSMLPGKSGPRAVAQQVRDLLKLTPMGRDDTPDLLGVALNGSVGRMDAALSLILNATSETVGDDVLVALAGTGGNSSDQASLAAGKLARQLERRVPGEERVIEAVAPGEIFVDQEALARSGISDDVVLKKLLEVENGRMFADIFPTVAVTFGRFCDG